MMGGEDESAATADARATGTEQYGITSAMANTLAAEANSFSKQFYKANVKPILGQIMNQGKVDNTKFNTLINQAGAYQTFRENYFREQGIPAITAYFDTVKEFSTAQYADNLVTGAVGDFTNQEQIAGEQTDRALAARGVAPNSGQAAQAAANRALQTRLAIADASRRARQAADEQKVALQGSAANLGAETESWAAPYMQLGGQLTETKSGVNNNRIQALATAQDIRLAGTKTSGAINAGNLSASSGILNNSTQLAAQEAQAGAEGMGKLAGLALGAGATVASGGNPIFLASALKGMG